mgnify:FL=1
MNTISENDIKKIIKEVIYTIIGQKTTICLLILENDFEVVGTSACVDKNNFNKEVGEKLAYEKAFEKIWELEGYRLQFKIGEKQI